jgi:hypothetical protein
MFDYGVLPQFSVRKLNNTQYILCNLKKIHFTPKVYDHEDLISVCCEKLDMM